MFVVRCIVVTVLLFTSATLALKCRTGRQLVLYGNNNQGDFDKVNCPPGINYCLKTRAPNQCNRIFFFFSLFFCHLK